MERYEVNQVSVTWLRYDHVIYCQLSVGGDKGHGEGQGPGGHG